MCIIDRIVCIITDEGKIHKIVQWNRNGDSQSALLDIFDVTPGEPIQVRTHTFETKESQVLNMLHLLVHRRVKLYFVLPELFSIKHCLF